MKKASGSLLVLFFVGILISTQTFAQMRQGNGAVQGQPGRDHTQQPQRPQQPQGPVAQPQQPQRPQQPQIPQEPQRPQQPQQPQYGQFPQYDEHYQGPSRDDRRDDRWGQQGPARRDDRRDDRWGQQGPARLPQYPYERQVAEFGMISVRVSQLIRYQGRVDLKELVREQTGLTLEGAEIQRVIVDGYNLSSYGRSAALQVLINGRPEGVERDLNPRIPLTPILVQSYDQVSWGLELQVIGDAQINSIQIRVGRVLPLRIR